MAKPATFFFLPTDLEDAPLKSPRSDPFHKMVPLLQGPMVKTPMTDLVGGLLSAQEGPKFCANIEMMMLNCMDQYGYHRGRKMCAGFVADLDECRFKNFEHTRNNIMREERRRQYLSGQRKEQYEPCAPHI